LYWGQESEYIEARAGSHGRRNASRVRFRRQRVQAFATRLVALGPSAA
jgi:hypothetical protein